MRHTLSLRIPEDLYEEIKSMSKKNKKSINQTILDLSRAGLFWGSNTWQHTAASNVVTTTSNDMVVNIYTGD